MHQTDKTGSAICAPFHLYLTWILF